MHTGASLWIRKSEFRKFIFHLSINLNSALIYQSIIFAYSITQNICLVLSPFWKILKFTQLVLPLSSHHGAMTIKNNEHINQWSALNRKTNSFLFSTSTMCQQDGTGSQCSSPLSNIVETVGSNSFKWHLCHLL